VGAGTHIQIGIAKRYSAGMGWDERTLPYVGLRFANPPEKSYGPLAQLSLVPSDRMSDASCFSSDRRSRERPFASVTEYDYMPRILGIISFPANNASPVT